MAILLPPPPHFDRRRAPVARLAAAAMAAATLFTAGITAAFAQSLTLQARVINAQGHVQLTVVRTDYMHPADGTNTVQIARCEIPAGMTTCSLLVSQGATALSFGNEDDHPGDMFTDTGAVGGIELGATYLYLWRDVIAGGNIQDESEPITIVFSGGDVAGDAILPNVLRSLPQSIHRGIADRIYQRQREDGKWK